MSSLSGFELEVKLPCALNDYYQARRGGWGLQRTKKGRISRDEIVEQICAKIGCAKPEALLGAVAVELDIYPNSHHAAKVADIDAYLKCLLDAFQWAEIYTDDGQIDSLLVNRHKHQKVQGGKIIANVREI